MITAEVDRVVARKLVVNRRGGLREVDDLKAAVGVGELLLDDVRLDRDPEMVGLAREVGGGLVVDPVLLEGGVPDVAPEHGGHPQLVRLVERNRDLLQLPV